MEPVSAEEKEEPPEGKKELPQRAPSSCIWPAAVAERYKRREKLGDGMFGDVYKACDRVGKRLSGRADEGLVPTSLQYFTREAMSLAACRGHPSIVKPGLKLLARRDVAAELREKGCAPYAGCLRDLFPEEVLSEAGFEVLSGLLEPNPDRRLTAAAALRRPWFRRRLGGGCSAP